MTVICSPPPSARSSVTRSLRFGSESAADGGSVRWLLKRNCSLTPRQMLAFVLSLSAVSLAIGSFCWAQGAPLVMPFTGIEVLAVSVASLLYARHAADCERIELESGRLVVQQDSARHVERVEFVPSWVQVESEQGNRSLIELSGQGRRIHVGRFVRPELRRQLADELRWALRRGQEPARAQTAALPADPPEI